MRIIQEIDNSKILKYRENNHYYTTHKTCDYSIRYMLSKINNDTEKFEIVPNIIFEDDIKPTSQKNVFENREGNTYFMWPSHNGRMLHKILKNKIIIIDGYYRGLFSFKYKMNKIRLIVV